MVPGLRDRQTLMGDGTAVVKTAADPSGNRRFESVSLQGRVCLSSEPLGCLRKARQFGGSLRVTGDARRDVQGTNRRSLAVFLGPALMQSHLPKVPTVCNDARAAVAAAAWGRFPGLQR